MLTDLRPVDVHLRARHRLSKLAGFVVRLGAKAAPEVFRLGSSRLFKFPLSDYYSYDVVDPVTGYQVGFRTERLKNSEASYVPYHHQELAPFKVYLLISAKGQRLKECDLPKAGGATPMPA